MELQSQSTLTARSTRCLSVPRSSSAAPIAGSACVRTAANHRLPPPATTAPSLKDCRLVCRMGRRPEEVYVLAGCFTSASVSQELICFFFFFFWVQCDDCAKSPVWWLLGSLPSAVVQQLAPSTWCPLQ